MEADTRSLSHPGWPGQRDSVGVRAGGITAYPGGGREGGMRMGAGCRAEMLESKASLRASTGTTGVPASTALLL